MAVAQSIFSHCGADFIAAWLADISGRLVDDGCLVATYLPSVAACGAQGWLYPECTSHPTTVMAGLAKAQGLSLRLLAWPHPRQQWAVFAKPGFDEARLGPWGLD
jgi:hypothetical protein